MTAFAYEVATLLQAQAQAKPDDPEGAYAMPWYLVLGEPQTGKSSAIKALNLSQLMSLTDEAVHGKIVASVLEAARGKAQEAALDRDQGSVVDVAVRQGGQFVPAAEPNQHMHAHGGIAIQDGGHERGVLRDPVFARLHLPSAGIRETR